MNPALVALLGPLLQNGLNLLGNAVLAKGQDWVEKKTGVKLGPNLTPEQIVLLKQAEMEHEVELMRLAQEDRKLNLAEIDAFLQDTQSARSMQGEALKQEDLFAKRFIYYFSIFWSAAAVLYVAGITFGHVPEQNVRFADTVLGFLLGTLISQIVGFFYGSSRSSQAKDKIIQEVVRDVTRK